MAEDCGARGELGEGSRIETNKDRLREHDLLAGGEIAEVR